MIFGCKKEQIIEPEEYEITISGKVVDKDGDALNDCVIKLITLSDSIMTTTNGEGLFLFSLTTTQIDSAILLTQKDDYVEQTTIIKNLSEDNKQNVTITLLKTVNEYEITISGKVVDESDNAIENCKLTLVTEKESINTYSDSEGYFRYSFISTFPDSFRIVTKIEDYLDETILFQNLTENEMRDLQIVLSSKYITISGVLTEIDENGEHPSVNTLVKLTVIIGDVYFYETATDQNGDFNVKVDKTGLPKTEIDEILIDVEKQGYEPLFVYYIEPNESTRMNISIQLLKYVNYFPLKVGNTWEYEVYRNGGDGYYNFKREGTEIWEITSLSGESFTLDIYFTGSKITYQWGNQVDSVYLNNEKTSYDLKFEEGSLIPQQQGGSAPIWAWGASKLNCVHPCSFNGLYSYGSQDSDFSYVLQVNRGIKTYSFDYTDGTSWHHIKLNLLYFAEGG